MTRPRIIQAARVKKGFSAATSFMESRFWFFITAIALLNLWLFSALDPYMLTHAGHDDALFVKLAESIGKGEWLGHFDEKTLIKGCFYPLFIALSYFLRLPLLFAEHLLYLASGAFLVGVLKSRYRNGFALFLLFAFFAFNPALTHHEPLRVIRDSLYVSETVFIFAALLGLLFSYMERGRVVLWSILLGFALAPFWLTREEGIWILPALISAMAYILGHCYIRRRGEKIFRLCLILFIPFLILFSGIKFVSSINYSRYGVGITTEFQSDYFISAYGALTRIKEEKWRRYVPVPREVREKLYPISPAFSELRPYFEGGPLDFWIKAGASYIDPGDDFSAHFVWAFRDAVARAGYYESAPEAKAYYVRLAREINDACEEGLLSCYGQRETMAPAFKREYMALTLEKLMGSFRYVSGFNFPVALSPDDLGPPAGIELFERLTHHRADTGEKERSTSMEASVSGWLFSPDKDVVLGVTSKEDGDPFLPMNVLPSPEIDARFKKLLNGDNGLRAKNCRFDFSASLKDTELVVMEGGKELHRFDLSSVKGIDTGTSEGPLLYHIRVSNPAAPPQDPGIGKIRKEVLVKVGKLYRLVVSKLFFLALIVPGFSLFLRLRKGKTLLPAIFNALLLLAILTRHVLLSYLDVTTFHGVNILYHQPTYALTLLFCGLSLFDLTDALLSRENRGWS